MKTSLRRAIIIAVSVSAVVLGVTAVASAVAAPPSATLVVAPSERATPEGQAALTEASATLREASSVMDVSEATERIDTMWVRDPFTVAAAKRTIAPVLAQLEAAKAIQAAVADASAATEDAKSVSVDASSIVLPSYLGALPTPDEVAATDITPLRDATASVKAATQAEKDRVAAEAAAAAAAAAQSESSRDESYQDDGFDGSSGGSRGAGSGGDYADAYINVVCTAPNDARMQQTIDDCSPDGWIQMSYYSNVPVIARHVNNGGSSILGLGAGDIVSVGGARFVVLGTAEISQQSSQDAVDDHAPGGSVLALQTCNWGGGPMRFVYLARA